MCTVLEHRKLKALEYYLYGTLLLCSSPAKFARSHTAGRRPTAIHNRSFIVRFHMLTSIRGPHIMTRPSGARGLARIGLSTL
jgi:hypothetical protein